MKLKIIFSIFFSGINFLAFAQDDCSGKYLKLIQKKEVISAPCDQMFLLNAETFGRFYYASVKLDSLILLLPKQANLLDSLNILSQEQFKILQEEIKASNIQLDEKANAIHRLNNLVQIAAANNEDCIKKYSTLAESNRKETRKKKFWRATTGILGGISVGLIIALLL